MSYKQGNNFMKKLLLKTVKTAISQIETFRDNHHQPLLYVLTKHSNFLIGTCLYRHICIGHIYYMYKIIL